MPKTLPNALKAGLGRKRSYYAFRFTWPSREIGVNYYANLVACGGRRTMWGSNACTESIGGRLEPVWKFMDERFFG